MTLDVIYNAIRANFPHTAEITTKTDKTLVVDFANTDYRLRFFRTSTNDIKVSLISFALNASNSGVLDFDFIRPDWSIEKLIDWAIYVITKEHAKELATWFASIPVIPVVASTASTSDRTQTALTGNIIHKCNSASCDNRAMYVVKIGLDSEFSQVYYACDSDDCNMLEWLKVASADEISNCVDLDAF